MQQTPTQISFIAYLAAICLSFFLSSPFAAAQSNSFVIEGEVQTSFLPIPLPGVEILAYTKDRLYVGGARTDLAGRFSVSFDVPSTDTITFIVEVDDPCVDGAVTEEVSTLVNPSFVSFKICPLDELFCSADFEALVAPELTVQFVTIDLFGTGEHSWDFGDGNASDEAIPTHQYTAAGEYEVTHIVQSENCNDTSSATVVVDAEICGCPKYYQPVCVTDSSGNKIEFDNPCFALCQGYRIFESCADSCTTCPDTIDPVCVRGLADEITFKNSCEAECAGFTDYYQCRPECDCDDVFAPVCGYLDDGTTPIRFENACRAECEGFLDLQPCDSCFCPDYFDAIDVCVVTEDGEMLNFSNPCEAECAGYSTYYFCDPECECPLDFEPVCLNGPEDGVEYFLNQCFADCQGKEDWIPCPDCACPWIYSPVCATDSTGETKWFANECFANCEGYFEFDSCDEFCICPEYYEPVCAINEAGDTLEFSNPCFAQCEGYGPDQIFRCDGSDECACIGLYDPVCAINAEGDTIEFSNACYAQCEGYGADQVFHCEVVSNCVCDAVYDPVCVFTDQGIEEFSSACVAICAGYDVFFNCERACDCPLDSMPVCVEFPFGGQIEILNACWADCLGLITVDCEDDEENSQVMGEMVVPESEIHQQAQSELSAFPNPFNQVLRLALPTKNLVESRIDVFDLLGRRVYHQEIPSAEKLSQLTINSQTWQSGVYLVNLSSREGSAVVRVVKE